MEKGKILVVASISVCVIVVVAVTGAYIAGTFESGNPDKETLKIGLIPTEDQLEMLKKFEPAKAYLERELDMPAETFMATDYTALTEAMRAKKIDVAYFGPFSYVLATERANAEAIVTGGTDTGDVATYHSCIVTHKDSGLKNIDDLKEHANEVTFAFVDPASTSGNLIPRGYLLSIGIDPDTDLKECMFAGGHDAVGLSVKSKKVDAGAMYDIGYNRLIDSGAITPEEVIVIWESDPIPKSPIAVRGDLDPVLKGKIQQAFVDMPEKDPEAMKTFESKWEKNKWYIAIDDSTYDYVRNIAIALGYIGGDSHVNS